MIKHIHVQNGLTYVAMPCGSIASAMTPAPDGVYAASEFVNGRYEPLDGVDSIVPPPGDLDTSTLLNADALQWVSRECYGEDYEQPFIAHGYLCGSRLGHRMRAAPINNKQLNIVLPAATGRYFVQSVANAMPLSVLKSGWAVITDPVTVRRLWFRAQRHERDVRGVIRCDQRQQCDFEPGMVAFPHRKLAFNEVLLQRIPPGRAYYDSLYNFVTIWHDDRRATAVAGLTSEAKT